MIRKDKKSVHALTEKDMNAIFSAIDLQLPDHPWHESSARARNQLILMLLFTGLRSGEVLQMRINDIDFVRGLLCTVYHPGPKMKYLSRSTC